MARYWSMPMRRVERSMMAEAMVATMVSTEQNKESFTKEEENWSSRLSGVSRKRENRLERTRLRTNLKMYD